MPRLAGGRALRLLAGLWVALLAGCADGPAPELARLNPFNSRQWAEDEKFGPTYYQKVAQFQSLERRAPGLDPAEQRQLSEQLAKFYREEPHPPLRTAALRCLAAFPTEISQATLLAAATDTSAGVRAVAARSLGRKKSGEALRALAEMVGSDADADVRMEAARALGEFQGPEATKALAVALEENDAAIQHVAMESLGRVTGKDYRGSVPHWRDYLAGKDPAPPPGPSLAEQVGRWWYW